MKQQIIGIERILLNRQKGLKWNNKKIKWSIAHNFNNQSRIYDVELEMVLVSSKRIVKVNDQIKNIQMCSFGYQAEFTITEKLKGFIKQDGLTFQLYINGNSFTKLQQQNHTYQPPKLGGSTVDSLQCNPHPKKQNETKNDIFKCVIKKQEQQAQKKQQTHSIDDLKKLQMRNSFKIQKRINVAKSMQYQLEPKLKQISSVNKTNSIIQKESKKSTENTLKDTQNQLMKILIQQKKLKKEQEMKKNQVQT